MSKRAWLLLGGLTRYGDGLVTSAGMFGLARQLRNDGVIVQAYPWAEYDLARREIIINQHVDKVIVIGYSGGGSRATWLANQEPRPTIDLMVCYDPSPAWQMINPIPPNVKRAICYHNARPMMFGLGGGVMHGKQVETDVIAEQHLAVQFDQRLHAHTIQAVRAL